MRLSLFHSFENNLNASYDSSLRNIRIYVSQDTPEPVLQGPLILDFIHSDNSDWAHGGASMRWKNYDVSFIEAYLHSFTAIQASVYTF
jgi:hypothetical protein